MPALSIPMPRREDTVFPLAEEDYNYDSFDEEEEYPRYTLNLGAGSECASLCPSACPTPPCRPSLKSLQIAPYISPAPAVPRSWEWQADELAAILAEPPSPASDSWLSSGSESSLSSDSSDSSHSPVSESFEEALTDDSLSALQHVRALQLCRHAPHPPSTVLGLRDGLLSVVRVIGCIVVVAVLAGSGRWGGGASL
ncbi:hypothetical protein B0H17DRAFT_1183164 [Mycena rosella]|uniref:Uncharacterized protein n=1 Tax=Mycena rosella TaxID=1033263 RepID=A0AAD7D163_MYCRO|nr:hypothetical protein B0H17DRAFT_1183164 [Mycena rosella]